MTACDYVVVALTVVAALGLVVGRLLQSAPVEPKVVHYPIYVQEITRRHRVPRIPRTLGRLLIPYQARDIRIEALAAPDWATYLIDHDGTLRLEASPFDPELDLAIDHILADLDGPLF